MARMDPHSFFDSDQPRTKHIELKWFVDLDARRLRGQAVLHFGGPVSGSLDLDSDRLAIESITTGEGLPVPFELGEEDPVLGRRVRLDVPPGSQKLVVAYETSPEATALQWLEPGQTAGKSHPFLFSQCQPTHARSLAPLQDSPRARVTYHAEVTVPAGLTAVMSAGPSGDSAGAAGTRTFLFDMPQPIPTYLLALAVGNLASRDLSPRSRVWA